MGKTIVFFIFALVSFCIALATAAYILFRRRPYYKRINLKKSKLLNKKAPIDGRIGENEREIRKLKFFKNYHNTTKEEIGESKKKIESLYEELEPLKQKQAELESDLEKLKVNGDKIFLASNLQLFTAAVFVSIFVMFLPVFYYDYELFGEFSYIRPILISIHTAIRTFILDGDFNTVSDAVKTLTPEWQRVAFSSYAAVLYVLAPVLTLTNLVYLFKNIFLEFWIKKLYRNRPMYIMSELNVCSMAMAESIVESSGESKKPVIVFTDVFEQNEEDDYELLLRARKIRAHCLKKDISHLDLSKRKSKTEIFLIGECEAGDNEAENIEHAIKLTRKYNEKKNFSIYVFAASAGSGHLIDSLKKGKNTIGDKFQKYISENPRDVLYGNEWRNQDIRVDDGFYIRRINCVEALVRNTLNDKDCYEAVLDGAKANDKNKTISIMIIGMGKYGKQFFKTALWFYQMEGYKLEINVFDADKYGIERTVKRLEQECPELISVNPCEADGEACYDIRYFSGIDCFTSDFDKCFDDPATAARLKRTSIAFVTLGDDDKNIEAAVMLRSLFDRKKAYTNSDVKEQTANPYEFPIINAVVYDEQRASNLTANKGELINHKKHPYHINFVGDRATQYDYSNIQSIHETERKAFEFHVDWMRKTAQLRKLYKNDPAFKETVDKEYKRNNQAISWGDEYVFATACKENESLRCEDCPKRKDCKLYVYDEKNNIYSRIREVDGEIDVGTLMDIASEYFGYEYYRRSSICKSIHKAITRDLFKEDSKHDKANPDTCTCEICEARRKTEHMRWNAYMRSEGYVKGVRNDRAKTHPNLCTWDELPYLDRFKD